MCGCLSSFLTTGDYEKHKKLPEDNSFRWTGMPAVYSNLTKESVETPKNSINNVLENQLQKVMG